MGNIFNYFTNLNKATQNAIYSIWEGLRRTEIPITKSKHDGIFK